VMAGIAVLLAEHAPTIEGFAHTLEHLRTVQGTHGQIASNYEWDGRQPSRVSFGTLAPRLDAATWYLIGAAVGSRAGIIRPERFHDSVRAVVELLEGIEYNGRHLLYVPAGGNWADEYIYDGYVLYDQILRAWGLRLLGSAYGNEAWRAKSACIDAAIATAYWHNDSSASQRPIASFSPLGRRDIFDLAACSMLGISDVASPRGEAALDWIAARYLRAGVLPPVFDPVIHEGDADWAALRNYHLHGFRNRPHEYHNGGIWPIWLGWLALAFARTNRMTEIELLRSLLAQQIATSSEWRFQEYLHGRTGLPGGTSQMAYSATGIVFLEHADASRLRAVLAG